MTDRFSKPRPVFSGKSGKVPEVEASGNVAPRPVLFPGSVEQIATPLIGKCLTDGGIDLDQSGQDQCGRHRLTPKARYRTAVSDLIQAHPELTR